MMKIYVCTICGYSYNPAKGDSYSNIDPGTDFEKLPPTWHCPVCLSVKDKFECAE